MYYTVLANNRVQCRLCPHQCIIANNNSGFCRVRTNKSGKLYSMVYGKPCSLDTGPIEKAPLYHFIPGHQRLCLATAGCNLRCKYCQNWLISQSEPGRVRTHELPPGQVVGEAIRRRVRSVSFTYTEPTVFYEYMLDISRMAQEGGLKVSIVSNGYIQEEPMRKLLAHVDAVKIDLKAFNDSFYRDIASASLEPVLQTLKVIGQEKKHLEIVNLLIPTLNDDMDEIKQMCDWICHELGEHIPLHFSRFFPSYRLTHLPATPVRTLGKAAETAQKAGLQYVYIGNVPGHAANSTYCPACSKKLVHRTHLQVLDNRITGGQCSGCKQPIHGIWE